MTMTLEELRTACISAICGVPSKNADQTIPLCIQSISAIPLPEAKPAEQPKCACGKDFKIGLCPCEELHLAAPQPDALAAPYGRCDECDSPYSYDPRDKGCICVPCTVWKLEVAQRGIERLKAENNALRIGDTCARQCEGTAYRIEAQNIKAEVSMLRSLCNKKTGAAMHFRSQLIDRNRELAAKNKALREVKAIVAQIMDPTVSVSKVKFLLHEINAKIDAELAREIEKGE